MPDTESTELKNIVQSELQPIAQKLEILTLKIEKQALEASAKAGTAAPAKAWWLTVVEFLALPAAIMAIVFQITQTTGNVQSQEKTAAETQKIRTEEIKTRAELEQLLDTIAEKKQKGVEAYRDEVEKTLPKLQETVERLKSLDAQSNRMFIESALAKYIILWVIFHAISLVFDILTQVWATLLSSSVVTFYNRRPKKGDEEKFEWRRKFVSWAVPVLSPIPSILRWSIQLSIFIALMIPLFDEVSRLLGSNLTFDSVFESAKALRISEAIGKVKTILFGSP